MKKIIPLLMVIAFLSSCNNSKYTVFTKDATIYSKTVKELNNIVLENNFPPMIAARNYAYASIAAYECMAAGDQTWNSLAGQLNGLMDVPKPKQGADIDFHWLLYSLFIKVGNAVTFPEGSMMGAYDILIHEADSMGIPSKKLEDTKNFADEISNAILAWSKKDNYAKTRGASRYNVDQTEGRWVPTPPMYATALEPHWNEIRPMVLDSAAQFMAPRPPLFDVKNTNSEYYKAMMHVKNTVDSLTDEQKHIADFWDDNPFKMNVTGHVMFATKKFSPAGHWMNIVGIGAMHAKADFNTTIAAYAETSIALFDGFIACWDEKYRSNYIRPETAINKYVDTDWQPYIQTPPFPSYTSGHSTISAASAEVMTKFFGEQNFTDTSLLEFGIANREIKTFRGAAQEASISRLYGGIHYSFDLDEGNKVGTKIGEFIVGKLKMKK